jgi:hypothetical protein
MRVTASLAAIGLLVGCHAKDGPSDPVGTTVMMNIGPGGGTVSTPAGASIVVPPGALPANTVMARPWAPTISSAPRARSFSSRLR